MKPLLFLFLFILAGCKMQDCNLYFRYTERDINELDLSRPNYVGDTQDDLIEAWWKVRGNCYNSTQTQVDSIEYKLSKYMGQ